MYGPPFAPSLLTRTPAEAFTDSLSALQALITALNDLDNLCETIEDAYNASLKNDKIERWDEKG